MIKTGNVNKDFFTNQTTILKILESVQLHSKIIEHLNSINEEEITDLAVDLRENIENLKRVYDLYASNMIAEKIKNNLSADEIKTYNMFSGTLERLFEDILK